MADPSRRRDPPAASTLCGTLADLKLLPLRRRLLPPPPAGAGGIEGRKGQTQGWAAPPAPSRGSAAGPGGGVRHRPTGYIGSWLVRSLLRRGYTVHAASRDLPAALGIRRGAAPPRRLKLFRAIMEEEGSYDEAVEGCVCVFHVAASMQSASPPTPPTRGGLTSSISTATAQGTPPVVEPPRRRRVLSRSVDSIWKEKPPRDGAGGGGADDGGGPFLTPEVPVSLRVLLSPITKDPLLYPILLAVNSRMGSISLVHIEDLVEAQIFLMEAAVAEGRYICSAGSCSMDTLAELLSSEYPPRLTELGFRFTHGVKEVVRETVACCVRAGFLRNPEAVCSSSSQE
ncbi:unnamed protein product [Spirodela intermedia]|uniref:NAD-dependent epimerase/dehydratase domain-containing protein n=1 Tax=Spirodela intermedia TaxID=51605 RepID=A0A7I8IKB3_SPIIN|nr:unnamed protein product [Spirodela intermedia]CAA6658328.1 unnamed protein product [Spirodela intermedia]